MTTPPPPLPPPRPPASQPGKRSSGKRLKIGLAAYAVLQIVVLALIFMPDRKSELEAIAEKCGNETYQLGDDGNSIRFAFKKSSPKEEIDFFKCVLDKAGAPDSVRFRIENTRPFDGAQQADWDGWELYWNNDLQTGEAKILLSKV